MKSLKLLTISLILVVLVGWSSSALAVEARFGVDSFILGAQMRAAMEEGIFEKYGIEAKILTFSYGVHTVDAILTGQTDFGVCMDFAMLTRLVTDQLVILATIIEPEPGWHKLAVTADIQGPEDLVGKKLGLATGTLQEYVTYKYLEVNGIPKDDVNYLRFTALYDIVAVIGTGDIDGAWVWGQGVEEVLKTEGIHILCDDGAAGHRSYGFLIASVDFVRANRELTVSIIKALTEATGWIINNMEEAAEIVAEQIGAPEKVILTEMERENYCLKFGRDHADSLNALLSWMYEAEIIEKHLEAEHYINTSPLWMSDPERVELHL